MLPAIGAPIGCQRQQRGHHRGQRPQKGHRGGGGQVQGDVVHHISPRHAQGGQDPILHRALPQPVPDALAKQQQQHCQSHGVAQGEHGVDRHDVKGELGDGVAEAVEQILQEDKAAGKPLGAGVGGHRERPFPKVDFTSYLIVARKKEREHWKRRRFLPHPKGFR